CVRAPELVSRGFLPIRNESDNSQVGGGPTETDFARGRIASVSPYCQRSWQRISHIAIITWLPDIPDGVPVLASGMLGPGGSQACWATCAPRDIRLQLHQKEGVDGTSNPKSPRITQAGGARRAAAGYNRRGRGADPGKKVAGQGGYSEGEETAQEE